MCIRGKAVAVGAISYYLDHFVVSRILRCTYGTEASIDYDPSDPEHRRRSSKKYLGITGEIQIDVFSPTLFKVTSFAFQLGDGGLNGFLGYTSIGYARIPRQSLLHQSIPSG